MRLIASLSPTQVRSKLAPGMTPEQALEKQVERYRTMSREERVAIALRLHELACEMARLGIRRQNPLASAPQVEALLRERLRLAWPV